MFKFKKKVPEEKFKEAFNALNNRVIDSSIKIEEQKREIERLNDVLNEHIIRETKPDVDSNTLKLILDNRFKVIYIPYSDGKVKEPLEYTFKDKELAVKWAKKHKENTKAILITDLISGETWTI